jgi:N-acetylmuramoyl-L-alanine amidase
MGFMTNSEEREKLASDRYQADLAKAITKGIIKYLEENS